jgi:hypothetical protein
VDQKLRSSSLTITEQRELPIEVKKEGPAGELGVGSGKVKEPLVVIPVWEGRALIVVVHGLDSRCLVSLFLHKIFRFFCDFWMNLNDVSFQDPLEKIV